MSHKLLAIFSRAMSSKLSIGLLLLFIVSCSSDDDPGANTESPRFVSSQVIGSKTTAQLIPFLQLAGIDIDAENWRYDVELFKINYKTNLEGEEIDASALVIIPDTEEDLGIISFHRGTITANHEAPSELSTTNILITLYGGLSSLGLAAVFPDMIGFGTSLGMTHPYYIKEITASTVRDAIIATTEFLQDREVSVSGDLFLAGYSQGGYITMAAQQSIEQTPINGLELIASFPAAGAYDVKGLQEYFFTLDTYEQPYYLGYIGVAYKEYFTLDITLSDIFNPPYDSIIPDLFDGSLSGSAINNQLSHEIDVLLRSEFLEGLDTDLKFAPFKQLLNENGLIDWHPSVPTYLYHGDADTFIPFQNSVDTYNILLANGANEEILSLTIFEGKDHAGGVIPFAEDVAKKLIEILNNN